MMEMQGNTTEIDERNLLRLDALLSHGYGLSPQLVMRSKGLSIEAKALYGYLSSFAGAGDTAFPSTSRILEELDISKNRFYKIRKELVSWGFISIETTATSAGLSPQDRDGVLPGSRTSSRAPVSVTLGETLAICAALTAPALTFGI